MSVNLTENQYRPMTRNKLDLNAKVTTDEHDRACLNCRQRHMPTPTFTQPIGRYLSNCNL